jgi:hypothetical protein
VAAPATCFHHPDRPAIALCVACRKRICAACATPWEGRQHCAACLLALGAAGGPERRPWGWAAMILAGLGVLAAVTWLRPFLAGLWAETW